MNLSFRSRVAALALSVVVAGLVGSRPAAADGDPCPCSLFPSTAVPGTPNDSDQQAQQQGIELGLDFASNVNGFVTAVRFYKGSGNTGLHVGDIWDGFGNRVNTFGEARSLTGETASGWQTLTFARPVPIVGSRPYRVGYHSNYGSYSSDPHFFNGDVVSLPIFGGSEGGGFYAYGGVQYPTQTFDNSNYWVDVVFVTHLTPQVTNASPVPNDPGVPVGAQPNSSGAIQATFNEPVVGSSVRMDLRAPDGSAVPGTVSYQQLMPGPSGVFTPTGPLAPGTTYTLTVSGATDAGGFTMAPQTWSFTTTGLCPCSLFPPFLAPAVPSSGDPLPVELGMTFVSDLAGTISGIRFYKSGDNTGTHVGELFTSGGQLLASADFTDETASGWQQVLFGTPVPVSAGTAYVAAYHTDNGNYSETDDGFLVMRVIDYLPVPTGSRAIGGLSGSFAYGTASTFPDQTFRAANYWVDVLFTPAQ